MSKFSVLICAAVLVGAQAISDVDRANIIQAALPAVTQCTEKFGVSLDDVRSALRARNPEALDPCLIACFFEAIGSINGDGHYVPEVAKQHIDKYITSPEDVNALKAVVTECTEVNKVEVSDGAAGCQRANLLTACYKSHQGGILIPSV